MENHHRPATSGRLAFFASPIARQAGRHGASESEVEPLSPSSADQQQASGPTASHSDGDFPELKRVRRITFCSVLAPLTRPSTRSPPFSRSSSTSSSLPITTSSPTRRDSRTATAPRPTSATSGTVETPMACWRRLTCAKQPPLVDVVPRDPVRRSLRHRQHILYAGRPWFDQARS